MFNVGDLVVLKKGAMSAFLEKGTVYEVVEIVTKYNKPAYFVSKIENRDIYAKPIFSFGYKFEEYIEDVPEETPENFSIDFEESDLIDKQEHYTANGIEPIEIMRKNMTQDEYRGFLLGNIIKYPLRYKRKNGLEDLRKAKTYLTWLIEDVEKRGL